MKLFVINLVVFTFFVVGCKKYEDGPRMSLYTKKERLTEKWKVDSAIQIDNSTGEEIDIINHFKKASFLFEKNQDYEIETFSTDESKYTIEYGSWEFTPKKTGVIIEGIQEEYNAETKSQLSETLIKRELIITKLLPEEIGLKYEVDENTMNHLTLTPKD